MAMLIALGQHKEKVVDFLNTKINPMAYYDCDRYWILLHELASDCPNSKDTEGFWTEISYRKESTFYKTDRGKKLNRSREFCKNKYPNWFVEIGRGEFERSVGSWRLVSIEVVEVPQ